MMKKTLQVTGLKNSHLPPNSDSYCGSTNSNTPLTLLHLLRERESGRGRQTERGEGGGGGGGVRGKVGGKRASEEQRKRQRE